MRQLHKLPVFLVSFAIVPAAYAQDDSEEMAVPQVYRDVVACQSITGDAERLACYDRQVAAMQAAERDDSIVVVDREEVREAERGLFGIRLPRIRLFGGDDEDRIDQIESTITRVSGSRTRGWTFRLENGSLWTQTETRDQTSRAPREGHSVVIRRAALGSFRAEIDGMRLIRVRRIE